MRWPAFAVLAYGMLAIQVGLAQGLAFEVSGGLVFPFFVLILAAFIGLWAAPQTVLIACVILGCLMDLTTGWPLESGADGQVTRHATFLGPYALGFLAGGFLMQRSRSVMLGKHPLTLGAMVLLAGVVVHGVVLLILGVRNFYDQPALAWSLGDEGVIRLLSLLYTAVVGTILAVPLHLIRGFLGLDATAGNSSGW